MIEADEEVRLAKSLKWIAVLRPAAAHGFFGKPHRIEFILPSSVRLLGMEDAGLS